MPKSIIVVIIIGIAATVAAASFVLLRAPVQKRAQLILNNFSFWYGGGTYWEQSYLWASVSVKDSKGNWVTGLSLNDFSLSEALINSTGHVIQERPITFDKPGYDCQFEGDGFWERSVTSEKLDIVFLVDMTGSMEEEMHGIHSELHEFVDRLQSEHVDFRMAVVKYGGSTKGNYPAESYGSWAATMPFRSVMEIEEIHQWLDNVQLSGGEWWDPVASYDQIMLVASEFDFREETRKVIVVITDSPAKSVYGTFWYAPDCSAATLSAVEQLLKEKGIEVLYSQPDELRHLEGYYDPNINPKAMAGFETLGKRISWPFQQEDIEIKSGQIVESQYFFAWMSRLKIPGHPRDYTVRVTVKAADPERQGEFVECSFSYVPCRQDTRLVISVYDEEGNPIGEEAVVNFWTKMGDRKEECYPSWIKPKDGLIIIDDMHVGNYYVTAYASGHPAYSYETLRYIKRFWIKIPAEGLNFSLQVETMDREMELAKARGLLKDLDECALPDSPFKDFVAEAEKWLDEIEADGVTWQEMVAIKRFYVALSGYVNLNEYAQREAESAVEDFQEIVQDIHKIVEQLRALKNTRKESIGEKFAGAALELAYDVLTSGRFTAAKEAVEKGLDLLEAYIEEKLIPELVDMVLEQIPDGTYKPFITMAINEYIGRPQLSKEVIEKDFVENILKPYYINKANAGLYTALESAENYTPQGKEPDDWESGMFRDFYEYRGIVNSVQDKAWKALRTQEDIKNWAEGLKGLVNILDTLADALDTLATFYPPFEDEAKAVHGIIAALDGIQVVPKAIEFGLEVDCIDTFGNRAELLSRTAFADIYFKG
jgi:hypothetical protein